MEGNELEMTKEELQVWIRQNVKENKQIVEVLEKCCLLQSLLERRERQVTHLLRLSKSVAACEALVKKQYSLLEWEYTETASDDVPVCEKVPPSTEDIPHAESPDPSFLTTSGPTPQFAKCLESVDPCTHSGKKPRTTLQKQPVVVLTRLSPSIIRTLLAPKPKNQVREEDSSLSEYSLLDSDTQWKPDEDSSDSDFSISNYNSGSNKRRKIVHKKEKGGKMASTQQASPKTGAQRNTEKTSTPRAKESTSTKTTTEKTSTSKPNQNTTTKTTTEKTSTPRAKESTSTKTTTEKTSTPRAKESTSAKTTIEKTSTPKPNQNTSTKTTIEKKSTPSANTNVVQDRQHEGLETAEPKHPDRPQVVACRTDRVVTVTPSQSTHEARNSKGPPSMPEENISVNMDVLAKSGDMEWQPGKILEVVKKGDGEVQYKIGFNNEGVTILPGHHIAFSRTPKLAQLFVGARVVVKCKDSPLQYSPGILSELPCRKNSMRFLVFTDEHMPLYTILPSLHLVCSPLVNPLDDIVNDSHRSFMKEYLDIWPYPPRAKYETGQTISAEVDGVQQRCKVMVVDCDLIQVVFQNDQHKDWIYRGSTRLQHIIHMKKQWALKKLGQKNKNSG